MKLFLSSYRMGNDPEKLAELVSGSRVALVIPNALDIAQDLEHKKGAVLREVNDLNSLGLDAEVLDLRDYFANSSGLKEKLQDSGMVWVIGGNTFVLRRAMRQSGLDHILLEKKNQASFVYAGYSAGACAATPTLRGLDLVDDPNDVPDGYNRAVVWDGLGLVHYCIAPHYHSDHPESERMNQAVEYFIENKVLFRALHDGEVIIEEI